jgi:sulfopyruvate decarboxylase subunit alpha
VQGKTADVFKLASSIEENMTTPNREIAEYARLLVEGLNEAGVSLVAAVPDSHMSGLHRLLREQNKIRYVLAGNEADLPGICAGAYFGGKKALMIMENSGLRQACEPISRFAFTHHVPMVMIMSYCGDFGERNWWAINHAQTMEPLLQALRIPYRVLSDPNEIKPSVKRAFMHADSSQWPVALAFTGDCLEVPAYLRKGTAHASN